LWIIDLALRCYSNYGSPTDELYHCKAYRYYHYRAYRYCHYRGYRYYYYRDYRY
jgi:hypothetical protein